MKSYTIYDSDGVILRTGRCVDTDFDIQAKEGEFIIEGYCNDDNNHKVINGQVVYSEKVSTIEEVQEDIRRERNIRLAQSDWTQMPDAPLTDEVKLQWATYRQELRDLPNNYSSLTSIDNVVFPEKP